ASTPIYVTTPTPSPATITLTNSGDAPLLISGISKSGANATEFEVSGSCYFDGGPVTVNANATCTITATFSPLSVNPTPNRSATLTVLSNAATNPSITVSGTATAPGSPSLVLGTTNLVFNTVTVGMTSAARQIAIQNNSSQMVTIQNVMSSSQEFAVPNQGCTGMPLDALGGARDSCVIDVTFAPAAAGTSSGTITIVPMNAGSPKVNVSGPGVMADTGAATL